LGAAPSSQPAPEAGPSELESIVVTATRRSNTLLETPLAVSAYSAETLRVSGVETLQDLSKIDAELLLLGSLLEDFRAAEANPFDVN